MDYDNILIYILYDNLGNRKSSYKKLLTSISSKSNRYNNIRQYIKNRYANSDSYNETIYRIYHHLENHPKCICGENLKYNKHKSCYYEHCSSKCSTNDIEVINKSKNTFSKNHPGYINVYQFNTTKEKIKQTNLERYGVEYIMQSEIYKNKYKSTNLERYNVEYPTQCSYIQEKIKQTNLERYNVEYPTQCSYIQEKIKQTNLERYGYYYILQSPIFQDKLINTFINKYNVINPQQLDYIKQKTQNTNYNKYGYKYYSCSEESKSKMSYFISSKEFQEYQYIKKKENNTFNTSKPEDTCYELLCKKYTDVIRQYRSTEYPYNCDFYIPSNDLYIEYQGSWTHGFHPFDPDNKDDIDKLKLWQSKNTKYYDNAIDTWTKRDIEKRNTATKNKLNYIEIWNLKDEL